VSGDRLSRGDSNRGARFPVTPGHSALPGWYPELLTSVSTRVANGHRTAIVAANKELLATYWAVGADILARQDEQGWGARIIDRLSADLRERFPDARGYSPRNLKYMRAFAAAWPDPAIVQRGVAQLPWRHHIALIEKLSDRDLRLWYAAQATENGWSRDVLAHHIATRLHERTGAAISNFAATLPPGDSDLAQQATRDPYLFDFIGQADIRREATAMYKLSIDTSTGRH
jgi:predicted nuclease of restriction endonuclease-like (RecB) superfamily